MHLIGATVEQSRPMLVCEAVAAITVSAVAGRLGAVAGTVPFAIAKTGEPLAALAPSSSERRAGRAERRRLAGVCAG